MTKLGVFKIDENVELPTKGTEQSSCYDIHSFLHNSYTVDIFNKGGVKARPVETDNATGEKYVILHSYERIKVPTGLIFDIPETHDIKVYPRSGLSLKNGISLSNCTAVIDSDYKNELFVTLINNSHDAFIITDKMRIAQFALCEKVVYKLEVIDKAPKMTTSRSGGLGSTGTSAVSNSGGKVNDKEAKTETTKPTTQSQKKLSTTEGK